MSSNFALSFQTAFAEDSVTPEVPVSESVDVPAEVPTETTSGDIINPLENLSTEILDRAIATPESGPKEVITVGEIIQRETSSTTQEVSEALENPIATSTDVVKDEFIVSTSTSTEITNATTTPVVVEETVEVSQLVSSTTPVVVEVATSTETLPELDFENSLVDLTLPENISEEILIKSAKDIESLPLRLSLSRTTSTSTPTLRNGYVVYSDVFSNTDVEYKITDTGLKENILLKNADHPSEFTYSMNLDNYDYVLADDILSLYKKGKQGNELFLLYKISAPYMQDQAGATSTQINLNIKEGELVITPNAGWLAQATYPVVVDPTVEVSVLNVHSHPVAGEAWNVDFTTVGVGDLTIRPTDQATINDDQFTSLFCGLEDRTASTTILEGDVIFYPDWNCEEVATVSHQTLVTGNHHLVFEFKGVEDTATSEAFNTNRTWDGGGGDANWSTDANWSSDTEPGVNDVAVFDGTCVSNCSPTIDASISVLGISMNAGYGGVVTQGSTRTVSLGTSGMVIAAGTFTGNNANISIIDGSFNQSGGTFTAPNATTSIDRNFTVSAGTFTASSGTFSFTESAGSADNATLTCTGVTFNKVALIKDQFSTLIISSGCTIPLGASPTTYSNGTFTNNGTITIASGTWTVNGSSASDNGSNMTNNGTITHSGSGWLSNGGLVMGSSGVVTYSGTTISFKKNLDVSVGTFPSGKTITFTDYDGNSDTTLTCGSVTFNQVIITKNGFAGGDMIISSGCTVPLGASPTTYIWGTSTFTNNGTITIASGTWTVNGSTASDNGSNMTNNGTITHSGSGWVSGGGLVMGSSGVVTYSGTTISFKKNLNLAVGTFPSGKTITFTDYDASSDTTLTCGSTTFNQIIITKNAFAGGDMIIASDCTVPLGASPTSYNWSGSTFTNNGIITIASGTWTANGGDASSNAPNLTNNGTITHSGSGWLSNGGLVMGSSGVVTYSGTTISFKRNLDLSVGTFPSGKTITFTDYDSSSDTTLTCSSTTFNQIVITKNAFAGGDMIISSDCTVPLGASPTTYNWSGSTFTNNGTITIDSGTWNVNPSGQGTNLTNNGTITHSGSGWVSGGGLVMGSSGVVTYAGSTMSFGKNLNLAVGTFPSGKTVTFNDYDSNSDTTLTSGSVTFAGLTVNKANGGDMIFADSFTNTGAFTFTAGVISNPASAITGIVQGNFSQVSAGTLGGANLTLSLEGSSNTTLSTTTNSSFASKLKINKTVGNSVTLSSSITLGNTFEINSGTFDQGATFNFKTGGATTVGSSGTWSNTGTGDITLSGDVANSGTISLDGSGAGCGGSDAIIIASSVASTQRTWSGSGTTSIYDVAVRDMAGSITARSSTNTSNNTWTFLGCNITPDTPTSLAPTAYVNGSWGTDNTPTITFTQSDSDVADTLRYHIEIDDTSNFSSLVIDAYSSFAAQGATSYTSSVLPEGQYYWRVQSSDGVATSSYATANSGAIAFGIDTVTPTAGTLALNSVSVTSITPTLSGASDAGSGLAAIPYIFYNTTNSTNSLATTSTTWQQTSLSPNVSYSYVVNVTDTAGNTATTSTSTIYTLANIPSSAAASADSGTQITFSWSANSNAAGTEYYATNITASTTSGWVTATSFASGGLSCATSYSFEVKARNGDGVETATTTLVSASTDACPVTPPGNSGGGGNGSPGGGVGGGIGSPPRQPGSGFSISINNGAAVTTSPLVTLKLNGGPDAVRMLISNSPEFTNATLQDYTNSIDWNMCTGICTNGTYAVYVKFYTIWGVASAAVYDTIEYSYLGPVYTPPVPNPLASLLAGLGASIDKKNWFSPLTGIVTGSKVSLKADVSLSDLGKDKIKYEFDCTSDGIIEHTLPNSNQTSVSANNTCIYPNVGLYAAKVNVTRLGAVTSKTVLITVGQAVPSPRPPVTPPNPQATTTPPVVPPVIVTPPVVTVPPVVVPPISNPPTETPPVEIPPTTPPSEVLPPATVPPVVLPETTPPSSGIIGSIVETIIAVASTTGAEVMGGIGSIVENVTGAIVRGSESVGESLAFITGGTNVAAYLISGDGTKIIKAVGNTLEKNKTLTHIGSISIAPVILAAQYSMSSNDLLLNVKTGSDLLYALISLFNGFFTAIGLRKRRRRWGTVYDSVTKQPIDPALVQLINVDTGKVVEESVTDMFGRFGFLDRIGRYTIRVQKSNYQFPSRIVTESKDLLFENVYHGEVFSILSVDNLIAPNIPMDQVTTDWNQIEKKRLGFSTNVYLDVLIAKFLQVVFWVGFVITGYLFFAHPDAVNTLFALIYVILAVLNTYLPKPHLWGRVTSSRIDPRGLLVELRHESIPDVVISKVFTNESGKFSLKAIPGRKYLLKVKMVGEFKNVLLAEEVVIVGGEGVVNKVINLD